MNNLDLIDVLVEASARPEIDFAESPVASPTNISIPHKADTDYLAHGYFRYIGKYPPQLVSYLLNKYKPQGPIADPMCGGGTTLIEARLRGIDAVGCDINPVARLVSTVASTPLNPDEFEASNRDFLAKLDDRIEGGRSLFSGNQKSSKQKLFEIPFCAEYFPPGTLEDISDYLDLVKTCNPKFSQMYSMCLLAVLRKISRANVKKMNLEIDDNKKTIEKLNHAVSKQIRSVELRNRQYSLMAKKCDIKVVEADAISTGLNPESFGVVFLHPPYLTNTAFSEFTQLQLAILGINHKSIWKRELRCRGSFLHEPNGLKKYLVGWSRIIGEAKRLLRPGGLMVAVVGDGQIDYVRIPVGAITIEYAKDQDLIFEEHLVHMLNNNTGQTQSRKMKGQHVIVLRKPK